MFSLSVRIIISIIIVTLALLTAAFTGLALMGLSDAFGNDAQTLDIGLKMLPFILGPLFVMHTLWSARSAINKYQILIPNI
jgi:hypothetical protein